MTDISIVALREIEALKYSRLFGSLELGLARERMPLSLAALHYGQPFHEGLRKNGYTPKHMHQVRVGRLMLDHQLNFRKVGINPDVVTAIGLTHDTPEENLKLTPDIMLDAYTGEVHTTLSQFPRLRGRPTPFEIEEVVAGAFALSKYVDGVKLPDADYFARVAANPLWMLAKLVDRYDNVCTMDELPPEKLVQYVESTPLLIEFAEKMLETHPQYTSVVSSFTHLIEDQLDTHLRLISKRVYDGEKNALVFAALTEAGKLTRPTIAETIQGSQADTPFAIA